VYPIKGEFQLKNAGFRYKNTGILALKNISLQIRAGEKIAIVGKTGSGKSTLAELLIRLFDTTEGEVLLDGISIQKHNLSLLRLRIAYLPQDVFLFSDTIAANIAFGNPDASMQEIMQMAELACVKDDIERLPNGFATLVGERGVTLSGGQKQRIALARAFLTNPDIIVLDDALSAVDTNTEKKILSWLQNALKDKTAILITQRANNLLGYDQIFVLEKGELIDSGTHEQLIEKEGFYRSIYEQQMNNQ
jgi:ATP-binding cassette subfamily B protein